MWREPLTGNMGENFEFTNLSTKRQRIAVLAGTQRSGIPTFAAFFAG